MPAGRTEISHPRAAQRTLSSRGPSVAAQKVEVSMSSLAWFRVIAPCVAGLGAILAACSTPPPSTGGGGTGKAQAREALERRIAELSGEAARLEDASQIRRLQRA